MKTSTASKSPTEGGIKLALAFLTDNWQNGFTFNQYNKIRSTIEGLLLDRHDAEAAARQQAKLDLLKLKSALNNLNTNMLGDCHAMLTHLIDSKQKAVEDDS